LSPPKPRNGESNELSVALARHLAVEVESARTGRDDSEVRERVRKTAREAEVEDREAMTSSAGVGVVNCVDECL
jgi:hypothetical protein